MSSDQAKHEGRTGGTRRPRTTSRRPGGDLGVSIRKIRKRLGLNQFNLGVRLGWAQSAVCQYESGDSRPQAERLIALLRIAATDDEQAPILSALEEYGVFSSDLSFAADSMTLDSPVPNQAAMSGVVANSDMGAR